MGQQGMRRGDIVGRAVLGLHSEPLRERVREMGGMLTFSQVLMSAPRLTLISAVKPAIPLHTSPVSVPLLSISKGNGVQQRKRTKGKGVSK